MTIGIVAGERERPGWRIAAVGLAIAVYIVFAWRFEFHCDDALISFRYSRNFADGFGLRYNIGADPPVEGYSNFLWTIWLSLFEVLDWDTARWACLGSAACGIALLIRVTSLAQRTWALGTSGVLAVGVYFATLPPLVIWSTGGLATMPATLLLFLTYERLLDTRSRGWQAAVFAVLACLMRVDGAIWVAMLLIAAAGVWWIEGRPRDLLLDMIRVAGAVAVVLTIHSIGRSWYYGDPIPHTLQVKGGVAPERLGRGVRYVGMWLLALPSITLVFIASARRWPRGSARVWLPALVLVGGGATAAIWVGGDFMPMWRFLVPVHPFVVLLLAATWLKSSSRPSLLGPILSVVCISLSAAVLLGFSLEPSSVRTGLHFRGNRPSHSEIDVWHRTKEFVSRTSVLGKAVALHTTPGESVVAGAVGGLGYYSDLFIYDRYGLVTREVVKDCPSGMRGAPGHDKRVSYMYFVPEQPTYLRAMLVFDEEEEAVPLPEMRSGYSLRQMIEVERYPLPPGEEYLGARELRLLRLKPDQADRP